MLFDKDYRKETPEIKEQLKRYSESSKTIMLPNQNEVRVPKFSIDNEYTQDFWRYISLFPNNGLIDPKFMDRQEYNEKIESFIQLIDRETSKERDILNFIRENEAYFIIGSLLRRFDFGHHGRFLFKEFPLGTSYAADFIIIGKGSGGYHLILVELESVYGRVTTSKGEFGEVIRKGLNQIEDWKSWLDSNYGNLREVFNKHKGSYEELPRELIDYDSTRMNYVVIGGRRTDFNEKTYSLRRRLERSDSIKLLHYDNLIDLSKELIVRGAY